MQKKKEFVNNQNVINRLQCNMEDFAKERMAICEKCGLYKQTDMGPKCNNQK